MCYLLDTTCLLKIQLPPTSTLFPYTTLFRSCDDTACAVLDGHGRVLASVVSSQLAAQDRKSTRLNSSHLVISYAVFCLKKQKQKEYPYSQYKPRSIIATD